VDLGQYLVDTLIGEGGAARVFRARDRISGHPVAVKLFRHELMNQKELLGRFRNEIELLARLDHPNIIPCLQDGEMDGIPWFATNLCARSLASRVLSQGAIDIRSMASYSAEVLDALAYLHDNGVVHRDVKPENLLLDDSDVALLGDFGIALDPARRPTVMGAVIGTPTFMPPEQYDDPSAADASADLFALGSTIYVCMTVKTAMPLLIPERRPKALARLPEDMRDIVARATHPDPDERYHSAAEMADELVDLM